MDKTIHRNSACTQPAISVYRAQFTGKPSTPFEKVLNVCMETTFKCDL